MARHLATRCFATLIASLASAAPSAEPVLRADLEDMRRIVEMTILYQTEHGSWPVGIAEHPELVYPPRTPEQARVITAVLFEVLAHHADEDPSVFFSEGSAVPEGLKPRPFAEIDEPEPAWAGSYAFDWAAGQAPDAARILIAHRTPVEDPDGHLVGACTAHGTGRLLPAVSVEGRRGGGEAWTTAGSGDWRVVDRDAGFEDDLYAPDRIDGEGGDDSLDRFRFGRAPRRECLLK